MQDNKQVIDELTQVIIKSVSESTTLISIEYVAAVILTLIGCISTLWQINKKNTEREQERLDLCEERYRQLNETVLVTSTELAHLKGRQEAVENLSKAVLDRLPQNNEVAGL
jgi:hypothetical protein